MRSKSSMFTIRPSPGTREPSLAMFERLVGNLIQRAPFDVPAYGRPTSLAHASGTTGSTTIFVRGGTFCREPFAGEVARVGARQDEPAVQRVHEPLAEQEHRAERVERRAQPSARGG